MDGAPALTQRLVTSMFSHDSLQGNGTAEQFAKNKVEKRIDINECSTAIEEIAWLAYRVAYLEKALMAEIGRNIYDDEYKRKA